MCRINSDLEIGWHGTLLPPTPSVSPPLGGGGLGQCLWHNNCSAAQQTTNVFVGGWALQTKTNDDLLIEKKKKLILPGGKCKETDV